MKQCHDVTSCLLLGAQMCCTHSQSKHCHANKPAYNAVTLTQVAFILSGMVYFQWSLHCGFIIPEPSYPGWWVWLYYINPVSWILYGFVVSQLGDITSTFVQVQQLTSRRQCSNDCRGGQCHIGTVQHIMSSVSETASDTASSPVHLCASCAEGGTPICQKPQPRASLVSCWHRMMATVIQVNEYLRQHFNYKHNTLGVAVAVLFAYIAIFGCARDVGAGSADGLHMLHKLG